MSFKEATSGSVWTKSDNNDISYSEGNVNINNTPLIVQEYDHSESKNAFSAVLYTEGRVVGICWAKLKPKGPKEAPSTSCRAQSSWR